MVSQPIDLSGRKAIVTGSSRGIGAAAALVLAREGADVALADLLPAEETARQVEALGRKAVQIKVDVSNAADVQKMVAEAIDKLGHIDILVNSAGIVQREGLTTTSESIWDRVMSIDLKGTFLCIQAVYPHMKERGYGKIVNVSSISGIKIGRASCRERV